MRVKIKPRSGKDIFKSVAQLVLILLLLASVAAWRGQLLGIKLKDSERQRTETILDIDLAKKHFPDAHKVIKNKDSYTIQNSKGQNLGYGQASNGKHGYGGKVPLFLFLTNQEKVHGISLGTNYESPDYLEDIIKAGYLEQWNGLSLDEVATKQIDAISGATVTSNAIHTGLLEMLNSELNFQKSWLNYKNAISLFLLLVLTLAYFFPQGFKKYRVALQISTIIVFGFWLRHMVSFLQITNWISGGMDWQVQIALLSILILSVLLPLFFGRAFYCAWVCPYGAAQELCGKLCAKKVSVPKKFKHTREVVFVVLLMVLWSGFIFDLSLIEPFSAFALSKANYFTLGLALFFLLVSTVIPNAWCRYFCPTGFIFEWIRKQRN